MERSARVRNGILLVTEIFPPSCMAKVQSSTCSTSMPGMARTAAAISCSCLVSRASTVMSRTVSVRPEMMTLSVSPSTTRATRATTAGGGDFARPDATGAADTTGRADATGAEPPTARGVPCGPMVPA